MTIERPQAFPPGRVDAAVRHGLGLAPEERKSQALLLDESVLRNVSLSTLPRYSRLGWMNRRRERQDVTKAVESLQVRPDDPTRLARTLSGGNQQKVVLARWLLGGSKLLLLDEPTRGVDVGARSEIYGLIRALADDGVGVLLVSSEVPEVLGLSDRVLVMRDGSVIHEAAADGHRRVAGPRHDHGRERRVSEPRRAPTPTDEQARVEAAAEHAAQGSGPARGVRNHPAIAPFLRNLGLVLVLIVLAIIGTATSDNFLTSDNIRNILVSSSVIGVVTVGMTFVIIGGGIDLSVGALVALASVWATTLRPRPTGPWVMILCALLVGTAVGLINGAFIAYGHLVPFIVTLAMMVSARGLAAKMADNKTQIVNVRPSRTSP